MSARVVVGLVVAVAAMAAATGASASVLVVGDSLGVGTGPSLLAALGGGIDADSQSGRTSSQGLAVLRDRLEPGHDTVVFDLGTNDGPTAVALTAGNLAAARDLVAGRCLVVATLNHPPVAGQRIATQNASIRGFARETPNAVLVDWNAAARATPGSLGSDGVHATSAGYALRGALFADAIASCLPGDRGAVARGGSGNGPAASSTRKPVARSRAERGPTLQAMALERIQGLLVGGLELDGGPIDLAAKARAIASDAGGRVQEALTPRGPEPVLGAP